MPHVVIAGAGAMGCLVGGLLAEGGLDVTLLARRSIHVTAIHSSGLRIVGYGGDRLVRVAATTDPAAIGLADLVLFQCKSYDTPSLAHAVRSWFPARSETVAVSLQNGLGNEEQIEARIGAGRVLGGLTTLGATLEAPGIVRAYDTLPTRIGELIGGVTPRVERLASLLTASGVPTQASDDIVRDKWGKLLLNVALSATSGITDLSIAEVLAIPALAETAWQAIAETQAVAAAAGIVLPADSALNLFTAVTESGAARNKTSMCRDMHARRRSEVDAIYGSVIRLAAKHRVATPTLQTLASLMAGIEQHYV